MPLSPPISRRALKHTRAIQAAAFQREDGFWDIDAHITDVKTRDISLGAGVRPAGAPIHDLWLRLTIDTGFNIVAVEAASDAVPYPGYCDTITPDYGMLVGLNLTKGFRHRVKERLAGTAGCTHLTELAQVLPTAAIQAFAGEVFPTLESAAGDPRGSHNQHNQHNQQHVQKPFQLDHCHALRTDGEAVAKYYPRWAVKPPAEV
ncbi:MAG: hypothetical protein JWQ23_3555 [Herminiimonas sp.]|nr:hypothetical protein [Herminiimonas sp.]